MSIGALTQARFGRLLGNEGQKFALDLVQEETTPMVKSSVIMTSALALVAVAGCATNSNMTASADSLERSADAFARDTRGYFRDAPEFADQAHVFRETLGRAGDREIVLAYEQLWRSYQVLREEVGRSDNQQVDLKPVRQAFRDVVRGMSAYADADTALYARGGFQHDPYYDP